MKRSTLLVTALVAASSTPLSCARRHVEGRRRLGVRQAVGRHRRRAARRRRLEPEGVSRARRGAGAGGVDPRRLLRRAARDRVDGLVQRLALASRTSAIARRSCTTARTRRGRWPIATRSCTTSSPSTKAERRVDLQFWSVAERQGAAGERRRAHAVSARPLDLVAERRRRLDARRVPGARQSRRAAARLAGELRRRAICRSRRSRGCARRSSGGTIRSSRRRCASASRSIRFCGRAAEAAGRTWGWMPQL